MQPRLAMPPPRLNPPLPRPVVPIPVLLAILAIAVGASFLLVPEQDELVDRLLRDQQYERLRKTLAEQDTQASSGELRKLSREELTLFAAMVRLTPRERLHLVFSVSNPPRYHALMHSLVLADVKFVDVLPPQEAWQLIEPHAQRIGSKAFMEVCDVLVRNALATGKPTLAATILDRECQEPSASLVTAKQMAVAHQWAGDPLGGAKALQAWQSRHPQALSADDVSMLRELGSTLALQGGAPSLALDLWMQGWSNPSTSEIDHALSLAAQCSRARDLMPWLAKQVATMPAAKLSLRALHDQAQRDARAFDDYTQRVRTLANLADWDSQFDAAFDQHMRLAAAGDAASLDRCIALSDFLGRDEDTVELLLFDHDLLKQRPQLTLPLAEMLAGLGRDAEAGALYKQWLEAHPQDRDASYAYACLLEDAGDEDGALAALEMVLKHHPGDVPAVKKLAENYIRADRQADALKLYAALKPGDHDAHTLENYELLAESLEDLPQLLAAQVLTLHKHDAITSYLDIAETAIQVPDPGPALDALRAGIALHEQSAPLREAVAAVYQKLGDEVQAMAVLMHDSIKTHQPGIEALLHLDTTNLEPARVLEFIGDDVEKRYQLTTASRLDLAVLCSQVHQNKRSEALFDSVPETAETMPAIAEARFESGSYDQAAELMQRYLAATPSAHADDWVFLGDIFDAMGRDADARNAYNQSIAILTANTPSRTTSSLAWPPTRPTTAP